MIFIFRALCSEGKKELAFRMLALVGKEKKPDYRIAHLADGNHEFLVANAKELFRLISLFPRSQRRRELETIREASVKTGNLEMALITAKKMSKQLTPSELRQILFSTTDPKTPGEVVLLNNGRNTRDLRGFARERIGICLQDGNLSLAWSIKVAVFKKPITPKEELSARNNMIEKGMVPEFLIAQFARTGRSDVPKDALLRATKNALTHGTFRSYQKGCHALGKAMTKEEIIAFLESFSLRRNVPLMDIENAIRELNYILNFKH